MFNWLKLKSISPRTLYRNRLFIERDSKTRRVMSNFGLTFRNSKWSDYTLNNVSLQSVERAKRLSVYFLIFTTILILILTTDTLSYLNVSTFGLQSLKESLWLLYDYSTLTLMLTFTSYRVISKQAALYCYDFMMLKLLKSQTPLKDKGLTFDPNSYRTTFDSTPFDSNFQLSTSNPSQVQHVLSTFLALPESQALNRKSLLMELYKTSKSGEFYQSDLQFYKHLFSTTECLLQNYSLSTISNLNQTQVTGLKSWRLLMMSEFQPHLHVILNYVLRNSSKSNLTQGGARGVNKLNLSTWDLTRCEVELSKKLTNKVWSTGSFYYSSLDMNTLNSFTTNPANYTLWNNSINQQTKFFKWMRWLYRYNILHRNVINYSHKVTNVKKLLSSGFFSSNLTKSNLWVSNSINLHGGNSDLLVNAWSTLYGDMMKTGGNNPSNSQLSPLLTGSNSLTNLKFYEHSYFFYLHRFENFNTLSNLLVSSNYTPTNSNRKFTSPATPNSVSSSNILTLTLRSYSLLNKSFLTYSSFDSTKTFLGKLPHKLSLNSTSVDGLMLESSKNMLQDSSNIDTLLNLTEVSRTQASSNPYFTHLLVNDSPELDSIWGWSSQTTSKTKQVPYTFLYMDALYTKDLVLKTKFSLNK